MTTYTYNKKNIVAVKYLPVTDTKGARIKITDVYDDKVSMTIGRDYEYTMFEQLESMGYSFMFENKGIEYWTML